MQIVRQRELRWRLLVSWPRIQSRVRGNAVKNGCSINDNCRVDISPLSDLPVQGGTSPVDRSHPRPGRPEAIRNYSNPRGKRFPAQEILSHTRLDRLRSSLARLD